MSHRFFVRFLLSVVLLMIAGLFTACQLTNKKQTTTTTNQETSTTTPNELLVMPRMSINTNGVSITSKEDYIDCTVTILSNNQDFNLNQVQAGIRLRGHSTSNFEKVPYRIRFQDKTQPLGLGSGPSRSWILLAEYMDISMLRNYISYNLAKKLLRNSFSSTVEFVEVYLNNVYKGVYLLAEQTQVGEYRVNIDESGVEDPFILDTGFLLELETDMTRRLAEGANMVDWFTIPGYTNLTVDFGWWNMAEYPLSNEVGFYLIKSEAKNLEQIQFIQNYMLDVYNAIYVDKTYEAVNELVDIESAVDMYIMQLLTNDMDYNYSSNYVYKDAGGKLVFGPPWDHDLCFGNHYQNREIDALHIYHLLYALSNYDWFRLLVLERWGIVNGPVLINLINEIRTLLTSTSSLNQIPFNNDYNLWKSTRRNDGWHGIYVQYTSQADAAAALVQWYDYRVIFINTMFEGWEEELN